MDETRTAPPRPTTRRLRTVLFGVTGLAVVMIVAGIWWFLRDDAPAEVSLDAAVETVETVSETEATEADDTADGAVGDGSVSGTWTVDTETGEFDYERATGSFVGFRIEEELNGIGSTTAVGRTGEVAGSVTIDGTTVTGASFEIDLTTITTDDSRRDDNVQDALETVDFPTATFVLTEPIELGADAADGAAVAATAAGELTIHGVTQVVGFDLEAQLVDGTIVVVGSTVVTFSDYGVEVPNGGPVISVDDFGVLELQLLLTA